MKQRKAKFCVSALLCILTMGLNAQQTTSVAGGDASGSGGYVSYTFGQTFYTTNTSLDGAITQGVQQPYEIYTLGIDDRSDIILKCLAYPNPTFDFIMLKIENIEIKDLSFQLFDISGKLLAYKNVESNETKIEMINYISDIYLLKVIQDSEILKTFKIIKTK
jgi:hypothetical protein